MAKAVFHIKKRKGGTCDPHCREDRRIPNADPARTHLNRTLINNGIEFSSVASAQARCREMERAKQQLESEIREREERQQELEEQERERAAERVRLRLQRDLRRAEIQREYERLDALAAKKEAERERQEKVLEEANERRRR